jgi:hypothetical protein
MGDAFRLIVKYAIPHLFCHCLVHEITMSEGGGETIDVRLYILEVGKQKMASFYSIL